TRRCNLKCIHCYSNSADIDYPDELTTEEGKILIDNLASFGSPVILFSGGEPLLRPDLLELAAFAVAHGLRTALSTNGTAIGPREAESLRGSGFSYVGISLDGIGPAHDRFRGMEGAFEKAVEGMRHCLRAELKTGIRFTLSRRTIEGLGAVIDLALSSGASRLCVYHLVPCGRGKEMGGEILAPREARDAMDLILRKAREAHRRNPAFELLTVDNHADGVYLYLRLRAEDPGRAEAARSLLDRAGGNRSGIGIACVDARGNVFPDQFSRSLVLGNVRERGFHDIWRDEGNTMLRDLRNRAGRLKGRCGRCGWKGLCNGNMRARALAVHGDLWAEDPGCYLTEGELAPR
ncbi:MAG: radical SAM protein, partial [Chlamydiota bacterium]